MNNMNNALDVVQNYSMEFWPIHKVYTGRDDSFFFHYFLVLWRPYQSDRVRDLSLHFSDKESLADWLEKNRVGAVLLDEVSMTFRAHCFGELQLSKDEQGYTFIERERHIDRAVRESFRREEVNRKLGEICRATIYTHYYEFPLTGQVPTWLLWKSSQHDDGIRYDVKHPTGFVHERTC